MTKTQTEILAEIARLPLAERRELIAHVQATGLLDDTFFARMSEAERGELEAGIAEADRGEVVDGDAAFDRIATKLGLERR